MKKANIKNTNKEEGQMIILMVILIAGTTLAAVAFSSFTVVSELRRVTDARLSTEALFAADTGIECILFKEFGHADYGLGCPPCVGGVEDCVTEEIRLFPDGPRFRFRFVRRDRIGEVERVVWESIGRDHLGRTSRSIQLTLREIVQ